MKPAMMVISIPKAHFLTRVDAAMSELAIDESTLVVITADHTTPVSLREHSGTQFRS